MTPNRRAVDNGYVPLRNGEKTIAAVIDMINQVDQRRYESHHETMAKIDKLEERVEEACTGVDEKIHACRIERETRTAEAEAYVASKIAEAKVRATMSGRMKTTLWSIGILGGLALSFVALVWR